MPLNETAALISKDFGLEASAEAFVDLDALRDALAIRVAELLDTNLHLLLSLLYRIDVQEARVKAALTQADPATLPTQLADLIIERQLQKVRIRLHYKNEL